MLRLRNYGLLINEEGMEFDSDSKVWWQFPERFGQLCGRQERIRASNYTHYLVF